MLGLDLVRSLDESWRETLDEVARERGWPTTHDVAKLGAQVEELSAAYNDPERARATTREFGAARLGFAFPRDVPKGAGAVRELVAARLLGLAPGEPLRILDVGAGLGATTWGLVRALAASGASGRVEAAWVDSDGEALRLGESVVRRRGGEGGVELAVRETARSTSELRGQAYDAVLLGNVLSELHVGTAPADRVARHAALLRELLERAGADGSLVVVEPALRDRTRHLHAVRDALVASGGVEVFAPCLHRAPCPALEHDLDWCHEDLPVDLPPWLVPVARSAGLRRQGLTFSYLAVRRRGPTLANLVGEVVGEVAPAHTGAGAMAPSGARLRVVSDPMRSKGKHEVFLCGEFATGVPDAPNASMVMARARATRLDRDRADSNAAWDVLRRGDVLVVDPPPRLERPRVGPETRVVSASWDPERPARAGKT
jgi:hypothetical protein